MADVTLETPDGPMPCFEARPAGATGAVIVIQEAFGVNDYIEDVANQLGSAGYHALAPHIFHRATEFRAGTRTAPYGDFAKVIPLFEGLTDDGIVADVDACRRRLHDRGWSDGQIGIVGFCFGGRATFLAAIERPFGAAVGFYGGGIVTPRFPQFPALVDRTGELQAPWLGLFGDQDESIPVDDVERLRSELAGAPVDAEIVRYPDAGHGFHCDRRDAFHEPSAADAWTRALVWLDQHLEKREP